MASSASTRGIAAIVGVGPKLGRSIARKFAHEGYTVAILARDLKRLSRFADEIAREEKAQVLPGMVERGRGTLLFSGCSASLNGIAGYSELCCGKFAMRALSQCLAREFQPLGIHVAHVIIHGIVGAPRGAVASTSQQRLLVEEQQQQQSGGRDVLMDPDALAQTYWYLHIQDRSAWTQEIDLHPSNQRYI
ncbi:hypothetical protein HAX54_040207 [Datura stramonium]|uniref:Uncharacterized protein n=1 Tax=Datura stramonium TaxID=4076 RepID=A0ABS8SK01_DATST|nr:hypothetical protein [Datura stramonium]